MEIKFDLPKIFNRTELLALLQQKGKSIGKSENDRLMVGTVGYPNVGKSSVINVLLGEKKVAVANMPGKTKHFQTLNLGKDLVLCDCPGLVFPSFANSRAEMMCCGVLRIETMKDYISPITLVLQKIPKEVIEAQYKIKLPPRESKKYNTSTFLQVFAAKKGWVTGRGLPNEAQAARKVMRDFTSGALVYVTLRPDY